MGHLQMSIQVSQLAIRDVASMASKAHVLVDGLAMTLEVELGGERLAAVWTLDAHAQMNRLDVTRQIGAPTELLRTKVTAVIHVGVRSPFVKI